MIFSKFYRWLQIIYAMASSIKVAFDIRAFFFFGGLAFLYYGLYLYRPWIAYVIIGILLMLLGWIMEDRKS